MIPALLSGLGALSAHVEPAPENVLTLHLRYQKKTATGDFHGVHETARWDARKTAIVICDMWDKHWCGGASRRVGELAPIMNGVVAAARSRGIFIIHAPSETMEFYKDTPQRRRAMDAPAAPAPKELHEWQGLDPAREPPLPIDDSDGGCDSGEKPWYRAWTREHPAIEIAPVDAISDKGDEVWNLLQQYGIENVILMGVHTNMCVLGRPFSIRKLVGLGKNVVLMRDMTDTMYNPKMRPFVDHFRGTDLVVEHIEKYWCPSITSQDITGQPAFRFKDDHRPE